MGKQNRQRRAEKRRREARRSSSGGRRPSFDYSVDAVIEGAVVLFVDGDVQAYREVVAMLAAGPPVPGGPALVDRAIAGQLARARDVAQRNGWTGPEMRRVLHKQLTARHARLGVGGEFGRWMATEGVSRLVAVASAVATLSWLMRLPALPAARMAPPAGDPRRLERIRALLAKAESTTFAEEADALTAKAQELMTRYAIDQAMVASAGSERVPSLRRLGVDDPYAGPKALLLGEIAAANRCRSVWSKEFGFSTVFGFEPDLDAVELLYTSLLVQASAGMKAGGARAFRQSFLVAFATRIGGRLREAAEASVADAAEEHGSALAPVLLARDSAVEEACHAAYPDLTRQAFSVTSYAGWAAGVTAAELATLSTRDEIDVLQKLVG